MNNSDMPATPTGFEIWSDPEKPEKGTIDCHGLTKREHFAGLALQGLLSNSVTGDSNLWETPKEWVKQMTETSVEMADALLKQLESKG